MMNTLFVKDREEWRAWLERHYDTERVIWLLFPKKHTGRTAIPYEDSVEEALCFGWIDSIVKRIDDDTYARKFTPRKDLSRWSDLNKRRLKKMMAAGRMTTAGLAKIHREVLDEKQSPSASPPNTEPEIPRHVIAALRANPPAWAFFNRLGQSYRRQYLRWVMSAKKDETQQRRLAELITTLAHNRKLGLK